MKAYEPPLSLWRLVEQHVSAHEQEEIKSMLGASLVEQSLELHGEIEMLLDIWREMRDGAADSTSPQNALPEPPDQRERLIQEICFFVSSVKERAREKGINPQVFLKGRNSQVLDYAAEVSRPGSALKRSSPSAHGRDSPLVPSDTHSSDPAENMEDNVRLVNKDLNFMNFNKVCESLRSTLVREVQRLMEDIQTLQTCLESEADSRDGQTPQLSVREPTLSELREERQQLEQDLLTAGKMVATPDVDRPNFKSRVAVLPPTPPDASESVRRAGASSPLKAVHGLGAAADNALDPGWICVSNEVESSGSPVIQPSAASKPTHKSNTTPASLENPAVRDKSQRNHMASQPVKPVKPTNPVKTVARKTSPTRTLNTSESVKHLRHKPVTQMEFSGGEMNKTMLSKVKQPLSQDHHPTTKGGNQSSLKAGRSQGDSPPNLVAAHTLTSPLLGSSSRRGNSPGRVQVLRLNSLSPASTSPALSVSSPSQPVVTVHSPARPKSAHADRFRKMVLGCRDGD